MELKGRPIIGHSVTSYGDVSLRWTFNGEK
jgi:hypothetical protein